MKSSNAIQNARTTLENIVRDVVGEDVENVVDHVEKIIQEGKTVLQSNLMKSCKSLPITDTIVAGVDCLSDVSRIYRED